jgi:hypothetical protein
VAKEPHLTSATADHRNLCSTHARKPHRMHPGPEQCLPGPNPHRMHSRAPAPSCIKLH